MEKQPKLCDEDSPNTTEEKSTQSIFDERFHVFMNQFGETCEDEGATIAIAIVVDPKIKDQPIIFTRGGSYETAMLMAHVLRNMKQMINNELNTDT
jgi:hypothetical protein|tara:strand:+ start:1231 stop:1518 length:288 start_codon:yes stop_codon:yes gene_type:complete